MTEETVQKILSVRDIDAGNTHTWDEVLAIAIKIAETLNAIYGREKRAIINIRPESVFIENERIKIDYFEHETSCEISHHQTVKDAYEDSAFLAPEVSDGEIGFYSDIYSLGGVFYILFGGDEADIIEDNENLEFPGKMHNQLQRLILQMLSPDKEKRPDIIKVIKKLREIKYHREHVSVVGKSFVLFFLIVLLFASGLKLFIQYDVPNVKSDVNRLEFLVDVFTTLDSDPKKIPQVFEKNFLNEPLKIKVKALDEKNYEAQTPVKIENSTISNLNISIIQNGIWASPDLCSGAGKTYKCSGIMKKNSDEMLIYSIYPAK